MGSLCRNLLHSFKSKARSYRTRMNALHCYLMYSWLLVHIQSMGEISPLVSISFCSRLEYTIDLMHLDLSTCTWMIAILLRTVSNGVIYVCDKHVTNINKIISIGLDLSFDLSFRAHSLPSASMYILSTYICKYLLTYQDFGFVHIALISRRRVSQPIQQCTKDDIQ